MPTNSTSGEEQAMRFNPLRTIVLLVAFGTMAGLGRAQQGAPAGNSRETRTATSDGSAQGSPAVATYTSTAPTFKARSPFPNLGGIYFSPEVPEQQMSNSQRLHSLIRDGKLELSLDDTIALALENNLDIAVARYQIPLAQADYLRTKSGGAVRGVTGATISNALFAGAIGGSSGAGGGGGTGNAGGITG